MLLEGLPSQVMLPYSLLCFVDMGSCCVAWANLNLVIPSPPEMCAPLPKFLSSIKRSPICSFMVHFFVIGAQS